MNTFEFHVSKNSRNKYQFEDSLFSVTGNLLIPNFPLAREVSEKINSVRKTEGRFDDLVTAGHINALGLMHELFHIVIRNYEKNENPGVFSRAIEHLNGGLSEAELIKILKNFVIEFPPVSVYKREISVEEYLSGYSGVKSNKEIIIEELILLNLENINPAVNQLSEFYSDKLLAGTTAYQTFIEQTEVFFSKEKPVGSENLSLINFLKKPIISSPYNIEHQLLFIKEKWGLYLSESFLEKILKGSDLIKEDYKIFVQHGGGEKGTPPVPHYEFTSGSLEELKAKMESGKKLTDEEHQFYYNEIEKFTEDTQWMPHVVMIAKNIFVWLDQLSKKYRIPITTLDQIPDEELDILARWNFTSLWLIGIWERSSASKKIKQSTGNLDATSSAYSLYDYVIAKELGGEDAFNVLKYKAMKRGIKMASDMVPNHTGIYSKWVVEKPDYFIQRDDKPYPSYSFTGPDLSEDQRVQIRIEDKYYTRTDAAVVFQRVDSYTGGVKYLYHGNDGTNMPWNDTSQLNLLNPEVRESLIQTIMHVARKTPIIRFDAAMTLAKKHFQRLWFPQPGSGGAIPSRSDFAMTRSEFDDAIPVEFWRDVVDRINSEMPNTLLLAEAFWLMESYFVRTLGMHRVYNSAFMHMMMKEENDKYRLLIKNTLDFNPEILKRYVNFMSNPDEETTVNQFGKGDKYFGVAVLMVTLPGLPMFGHGQVEGFSEKYGMEYKRAYYDEIPDQHLIWQHQQEIFPLLKMRYLFSQAGFFQLYDFIDNHGNINENVFAYTNKTGKESVLVLYNNSYSDCRGTINFSVAKAYSESNESQNGFIRVAAALGFKASNKYYYSCREHKTKLQYLFSGREMSDHGYNIFLRGYQYKIFLDFNEIYDHDGKYEELYRRLENKGVESIAIRLKEIESEALHKSFINFFHSDLYKSIIENTFDLSVAGQRRKQKNKNDAPDPAEFTKLIKELSKKLDIKDADTIYKSFLSDIEKVKQYHLSTSKKRPDDKNESLLSYRNEQSFLICYLFLRRIIEKIITLNNSVSILFDELLLTHVAYRLFSEWEEVQDAQSHKIQLLRFLLTQKVFKYLSSYSKSGEVITRKSINAASKSEKAEVPVSPVTFVSDLFSSDDIFNLLLVNEYNGIRYFSKERFDSFVDWLSILTGIASVGKKSAKKTKKPVTTVDKNKSKPVKPVKKKSVLSFPELYSSLKNDSTEAGYDLDKFIKLISGKKKPEIKKQKLTRGKIGNDQK